MHSKPPIWRRILIDPDTFLADLHLILQTTMGWTNSHLHQFIHRNRFYTEYDPDNDLWGALDNVDYAGLHVRDLLKRRNDKMIYEYDFGDGWEHQVLLEDIVDVDQGIAYPICIGGRCACPPEDCGGVWGYQGLLDVLSDPTGPEYEAMIEWLGEDFDPKYFDKQAVNEMLRSGD